MIEFMFDMIGIALFASISFALIVIALATAYAAVKGLME